MMSDANDHLSTSAVRVFACPAPASRGAVMSGICFWAAALLLVFYAPWAWAEADEISRQLQGETKRLASEAREQGTMAVRGADGWLFFDQELEHVGAGRFWGSDAAATSRANNPEYADPLPAILDFQAQLTTAGVDLLLVPVPPKIVVYPDKLSADLHLEAPLPRLDITHQEFYALLRENGVRLLDLTDVFLQERDTQHGPVYCRQDTHWSGAGCVLAAQRIVDQVKQMPWYAASARQTFEGQWQDVLISGDLWQALEDPGLDRETVTLRRVGRPSASGLEPVQPDQASPVVLLGDSHNLVFQAGGDMHARGAGLADQLALELGFPVDLIAVRGSGATPARINLFRRAQRDPDYWQDKKLVIWVFTAREFTHADGWRIVPIAP